MRLSMNSITVPKIREALYDFICEYIQPEVERDNVIWGNQNNITLPESSNDYVIFTLLDTVRHGTNYDNYDSENEELSVKEGNEFTVQIDCYCDSENGNDGLIALSRAKSLEMLLRDGIANRFLKPYGISALYCDDARDTTITGDSGLLVRRFTVIAHLYSIYEYVTTIEGFTTAQIMITNSIQTQKTAEEWAQTHNKAGHMGVIEVDNFTKK